MSQNFDFGGDEVAQAWERHRNRLFKWSIPLAGWMVDRVDPRPGQTILELAAGPGETGFLAAARLGPEGRLISSDLNEGMVDAARRGADAQGITNAEFRVIDAQAIDLADASVDGVLSRFGLMLVPEPRRAFAECRRVLRRGGRLAYGVWGAFDRNQWLTQLVGALLQHGHAPSGDPFGPGGPFSLADRQANRDLLDDAGFTDVQFQEFEGVMDYADLDDYWNVQTAVSGPISPLVAVLSDDERAAVKTTLETTAAEYRTDDGGYAFPTFSLGVSAA
jgi:SAM-dependent methyltransferase